MTYRQKESFVSQPLSVPAPGMVDLSSGIGVEEYLAPEEHLGGFQGPSLLLADPANGMLFEELIPDFGILLLFLSPTLRPLLHRLPFLHALPMVFEGGARGEGDLASQGPERTL